MAVMTWKHEKLGEHIHVNVYMSGALSGKLCFRVDEFEFLQSELCGHIDFVEIIHTGAV
jgi:hypothetical protein